MQGIYSIYVISKMFKIHIMHEVLPHHWNLHP